MKEDASGRRQRAVMATDAEWIGSAGRRRESGMDLSRFVMSTAAGICTGTAAQKCTTGSVVACPRSPMGGTRRAG